MIEFTKGRSQEILVKAHAEMGKKILVLCAKPESVPALAALYRNYPNVRVECVQKSEKKRWQSGRSK